MNWIALQRGEGQPLFDDFLYHFSRVRAFYPFPWQSLPEGVEWLTSDFHPVANREVLARVLVEQNQRWQAAEPALRNAAALGQEGTYAVVTGQQAGMLSGPLYTPWKILSTIALARRLSQQYAPARFVPVFWLEVEDNDFREIDHIHILDARYELHRLALPENPQEHYRPIYLRQLPAQIAEWQSALTERLPESEFKAGVLERIFDCYREGRNFAQAFACLLSALFSRYGLVLLDPTAPQLKQLVLPLLEQALHRNEELHNRLQERNDQLRQAGYSPQIELPPQHTGLFWLDDEQRRVRIDRDEQGRFLLRYTGRHQPFPDGDPDKHLASEPWRFIPGVALRPLVQDFLLPTRAYLAGPSETAYFAQLSALYPLFGLKMPLLVPRHRMTLVEPAVQKILQRHHLDYPLLFQHSQDLLDWYVHSREHAATFQRIEQIRQDALGVLQHLEPIVQQTDPTLLRPYQKTLASVERNLDQLMGKLIRALQSKHQVEIAQLSRVQRALFPLNRPQERVLNLVPFLVKHGWDFPGQLLDALPGNPAPHWIVEL